MKVTFAIGDRIELMHIKSAIGRKVSDKKYGSQLLDFDGDRTAKIAMPISEGKVIPLEIDDDYNLCFLQTPVCISVQHGLRNVTQKIVCM